MGKLNDSNAKRDKRRREQEEEEEEEEGGGGSDKKRILWIVYIYTKEMCVIS